MSNLSSAILSEALAYANPVDIKGKLAELRETAPVSLVEPEGIRPYWAVTRLEDIRYIESNPQLFSAEPRAILILEALEKENQERFGEIMGVKTLVHMDGPRHMELRKITRDWFMPANISKLRGHVEELAAGFIERMKGMDGKCDFATDIAFWYPLRVVLQLIGIPEEDEAKILGLTQALFAPDAFATEEKDVMAVFFETITAMGEYFTLLIEDRRANPKDDIASLLSNATLDGELIDHFTLTSYFVLLSTAGHDTTSASLAGGIQALIQNPKQMELLLANPELYPQAADEIIRWVSPVKHFARTVLEDTELGGVPLKKGDTVAMFFESANRDETAIERAGEFDITRKSTKHMAFGYGRHNCLGMHLARMEVETFLRLLLPQLESLSLNGEPSYIPSHFVSGLSSLPITFKFKD
ncbi:cytochrome P450 [Spongiibacter sp. KMU-158]|uniref:Cytochrome P450 n=1 Tax=Spongiibacter pelagi TaxID=2760804 RepID=A0A927C0B8_9GAMM|nr:cytochrome P450 [Spongiibacter pelagi]MBD2858914.1 cytochrome P450 [Spongiibacter pelagi]